MKPNPTETTRSKPSSWELALAITLCMAFQAFMTPTLAIAGRAPSSKRSPDLSSTSFKQETEVPATVHLSGVLTCVSSDSARSPAAAQDCVLKFQDIQTGKLYQLSHAETLMDLYLSGTRKITIGGLLSGDKENNPTIQVKETSTPN